MKQLHSALIIAIFFIFTANTFPAGREIEIEKNSIIELENRLAEKQAEINDLQAELSSMRSENIAFGEAGSFLLAGFGNSSAVFMYMLLFSIAVGVVSTVVVKRKTQSLCHCLNRRKKLLKKQKMLEKQSISPKI